MSQKKVKIQKDFEGRVAATKALKEIAGHYRTLYKMHEDLQKRYFIALATLAGLVIAVVCSVIKIFMM